MAGFHTKTFLKYDDYMTPFSAWKSIDKYIPKDKVIWESFYGNGESAKHLLKLGCKQVIHEPIDFFKNNKGDVIISNPPFSLKKEALTYLKKLDKPFIMIMPSPTIHTKYMRELFSNSKDPIQIIIPRKRIQFEKIENGKKIITNKCNFDCFYYCYKMNLPRDIVWLF